MFDVGWSEMAIIAVVILVVLGPKELPHALKTMSHWLRAARKLGAEFQSGVNEIVRDAELEDARKQLQGLTKNTIEKKIGAAIDPTGDIKKAMTETVEAAKHDDVPATAPNINPAVIPSDLSVEADSKTDKVPEAVAKNDLPASAAVSEKSVSA